MKSSVSKKVGTVFVFLADLVVTSFCTVWMWNNIIARLFQVPEITIMQGWALLCAITYFVKDISREKTEDYFKSYLYDLIYTLICWAFSFVIVIFAFLNGGNYGKRNYCD